MELASKLGSVESPPIGGTCQELRVFTLAFTGCLPVRISLHPTSPPHRFIKRRHWNLQRPGHAGTDLGSLKVSRMSNVLGGGLLSWGGRDLGEAA